MVFNSAKINSRTAILGAMVLLAPLTGCLSTPVSSMVKLSRLEPLEANPADMQFAVRSPNFMRVRDGDITFSLSFDTGNAETSFVEVYKPVIDENARPEQGISIGTQDGSRLAIAQFSKTDATSMVKAQNRIKKMRAEGIKGKGSISVGAKGCAQGAVPDGPILLTTWIKTAPSEDFFILARNVDLRKALKQSKHKISDIPACD